MVFYEAPHKLPGPLRALLAALGDPHKKLRFVHVAGTNGKGSTAAMLASCLQAAGYRVGLFTSPFINRFIERIQVDGQQIPDEELVRLVEQGVPPRTAQKMVREEAVQCLASAL